MGTVVKIINKRTIFQRILHKLFSCPTFWQVKPAFECPDCGKKYRCYWDGHDAGGKINLCGECAAKYKD